MVAGLLAPCFGKFTHSLSYPSDRLAHLHGQFDGTELEKQFPRPRFRVVVLFVDEHESIQRQLKRGRDVMKHNQRVSEAQAKGEPKAHLLELMEVRDTDLHVRAFGIAPVRVPG